MRRLVAATALIAALMAPSIAAASAQVAGTHRTALVARDGVGLFSRPSTASPRLATLVQQTQVELLHKRAGWDQVRIWDSTSGWVRPGDVTFRRPWPTVSTYRPPAVKGGARPSALQPIGVSARLLTGESVLDRPDGVPAGYDPGGWTVNVTGWQQDGHGAMWYRTERGWLKGDSVQFLLPSPVPAGASGSPIWARVAGKGMWLTLGTITGVQPDVLVAAARRNGVTHLYLEAAISSLGFHGRNAVGDLIEAAHRQHLAAVAWVYPYLQDVAADVSLTREVAAYKTASGERFDGIAADIERNFTLSNVRAYSQLVRLYLGAGYLLVGVTYPPQSIPTYPFAEIGLRYNVIAPMDYWHQTETGYGLDYGHLAYGAAYGFRYATDSIELIHRAAPKAIVAPIGQAFDDFGRLEMGPHAPSGAEIRGFLDGSRAAGAIGVSFFQWVTATRAEWTVIHNFTF